MEQGLDKERLEKKVIQHQKELWKRLGYPYKDEEKSEYDHKRMVEEKVRGIFEEMKATLDGATEAYKPSWLVTMKYQKVLDAYVAKEKQQAVLDFLDKYREFSYSRGYYRRSVRTQKSWNFSSSDLKHLFENHYNLTFYGKTMEEYYENVDFRMEVERLLGMYSSVCLIGEGEVIAAELDAANTRLAQILEDILMSENNTNVVTREIIEVS